MNNDDILVESYSDSINAILNEIPEATRPRIEYVDSAYRSGRNRGSREIQIDDIAFSLRSENLIILQRRITQEKKRSILTGIDHVISFNGIRPSMSSASQQVLNTDERFVEHTVRHEIAHLQGTTSEAEADKFAFEQMDIPVTIRILI